MIYYCITHNDKFIHFLEIHNELWCQRIILPKNVPKSWLIYEGKSVEEFAETLIDCDELQFVGIAKKICYELYMKYIAASAEFEINIAYRTRSRLIAQMDNVAEWMSDRKIGIRELLHVFDRGCDEIFALMGDSYRRFQDTSQYLVVKRLLLL